MSDTGRYIPAEIRREVRKRCYFGCVVCGMPFYEYEHVEDYADNKIHEVKNLVLLCPNHHDMKTHKKSLSRERIKYFQQNPYNKNQPFTSKIVIEPTKTIDCIVGSNSVHRLCFDAQNEHCVIWVNGVKFLTLHNENGWLSLSLLLTDTEGKTLLKVDKGELVATTEQWDYEYTGDTIIIRSGLGEQLLKLSLSHKLIHIEKGAFVTITGDGYIVEREKLIAKGIDYENPYTGCSENYCVGGWALLNRRNCLLLSNPPGGYGFACVQ